MRPVECKETKGSKSCRTLCRTAIELRVIADDMEVYKTNKCRQGYLENKFL